MKTHRSAASFVHAVWPIALMLSGGCAADEEDALPDEVVQTDAAIVRGKASTAKQDAVVMLRLGEEGVCSGTLVAPNLVLTARHCISQTDEGLSCGADGIAQSGGAIFGDRVAAEIVVYAGRDQTQLQAVARGAHLIRDGAKNLCNHDIAFVVLDRPVHGIVAAPLRLARTTRVGEVATAVGWGLTSQDQLPKARMQRQGVGVLDVGHSAAMAANELVVGESICSGDSGGPLLSPSGAVIGVVSRGGNGLYDPRHPAKSCIGPHARNVYSQVAGFPALVKSAFAAAGATPRRE